MLRLEKQVCSLKHAKKLKELGVEQESYFYWIQYSGISGPSYDLHYLPSDYFIEKNCNPPGHYYSAFTVAELMNMLPHILIENTELSGGCVYYLSISKSSEGLFKLLYQRPNGSKLFSGEHACYCLEFFDETMADVAAKALMYLIENKLVSVSEINESLS